MGKAKITATVKQNGKAWKLSFDCTVQKASLVFAAKQAKNTTAESPASVEVGKTLKTGLRLNGRIASVYNGKNKENYNVRATVYNAKTGKKLASYKSAYDNKYVSVAKDGRITGKKAGKYYIVFTSYPKGLTKRVYVTVKKAQDKKEITEVPEVTEEPGVTYVPNPGVTKTPEAAPEETEEPEEPVITPAVTEKPAVTPEVTKEPEVTPVSPDKDKLKKCSVNFKFANGAEDTGAELPSGADYEKGTLIDELPTPYLLNGIFMGWYYDAEKKQAVNAGDKVDSDMTLYADFMLTEGQEIVETPTFTSVTLLPEEVSGFTFKIKGYEKGCIDSFIDVADNSQVEYDVKGETVVPKLSKGKTYTLTLKDNGPVKENIAQFVIDGVVYETSVVTLNIITEKEAVSNLSLAEDMLFVPASDISNISGTLLDGIYTVQMDDNNGTDTSENMYKGSFRYNGSRNIRVGDTVAIYEGLRPDLRSFETTGTDDDGAIAYVVITGINGNSYSYMNADAKDVFKFTEVIPVSVNADTDGDKNNNSMTADRSAFDFSDAVYSDMGLNEDTTVDEGDFLVFYSGASLEEGALEGYARVTDVSESGSSLIIKYTAATEDEVEASMDINGTRDADIEMTDDEIQRLEEDIRAQAYASGFLDEAAEYLLALAAETNGFKELSDDLDLDLDSYNIRLSDGSSPEDLGDFSLMGTTASLKDSETKIDVKIKANSPLEHFKNRKGISVELGMNFVVVIQSDSVKNGHLELNIQACFVEEAVLQVNIDGGAVWKKKLKIIPYIADYRATANVDMGSYTNVGISATLKTVRDIPKKDGEKEGTIGKIWNKVNTKYARDAILDIGKEMTELADDKGFMSGLIDSLYPEEAKTLSEKYAKFIKDSSNTWIDIVTKPIFKYDGSIDFLHILAYGVSASFVVKANLYITMGAKFEASELKRYTYSFSIFKRTATTSVTDLEKHNFTLEFYVFGTAGLKVGLELELYVGLFSKKIDTIGIVAGAGVYAQLWGYFYFKYTDKYDEKGMHIKDEYCSGALYFELGCYLEVKFKAQFFNSAKLTYNPTIFEKNWVLLTAGDKNDVMAFEYGNREDGYSNTFEIIGTREQTIDKTIFDMSFTDLKNGKTGTANYDDDTESHYEITFSNRYFSYDPKTDRILINVPAGESVYEESDMKIVWKDSALAFSVKPIEQNVKIIWSDPENARCIHFDSNGGSMVKTIALALDKTVYVPSDPVKQGYVFDGWYSDKEFTEKFVFPEKMPDYENKGVTVYAKWLPAKDTPFTVEHYVQSSNGKYELRFTADEKGETDSFPAPESILKQIKGAVYNDSYISVIRPDGQSQMRVYYNLVTCDISFTYGMLADGTENTEPLKYSVKYGMGMYAPLLAVPGYEFMGFEGLETDGNGFFVADGSAVYKAEWKPSEETPYLIERYVVNPEVEVYELMDTIYSEGETGCNIDFEMAKLCGAEYKYSNYSVKNTDIAMPAISANGDTVIRLYFDRTQYMLNYMNGQYTYGSPVSLKWGQRIVPPANPTKQGYIFTGWYSDISCASDSIFEFGKTVMPPENLTLYAGWIPAEDTKYTIEHYLQNPDNDGYTLYKRDDSLRGVTGTIAEADYINIENSIKAENAKGTIVSDNIKADGSTVLKLYYDRNKVKVVFDANGGYFGNDKTTGTGTTTIEFRYGQKLNASLPVNEGYGFNKWVDAFGREYEEGASILTAGDLELKAVWNPGEVNYTVEHYVMDTDGHYSEGIPTKSITKSGVTDDELRLSELTDTDLMSDNENQIKYSYAMIENDGSYEECEKATVRTGMVIRIYYERMKYTLEWNFEGYNPTNQNYTKGDVYCGTDIIVPTFNVKGYTYKYQETFQGEQTTYIDTVPSVMPSADTEYKVIFEPISYRVIFHNGYDNSESTNIQIIRYDEETGLYDNTFTRTGYEFKGWANKPNDFEVLSDNKVLNLCDTENAEYNLYAVWEPKTYKIRLCFDENEYSNVADLNISDENVHSDTEGYYADYRYGSEYVLPIPTITGFIFNGWKSAGDGWNTEGKTESKIGPGNTNLDFNAVTQGCINLKAEFEAISYIINWDTCASDGGITISSEGSEKTGFNTENGNITMPGLSAEIWKKDGMTYSFDGWYTGKGGSGKKLEGKLDDVIKAATDNEITLYANWIGSTTICSVTVYQDDLSYKVYEAKYGTTYNTLAENEGLDLKPLSDNVYGRFVGWIICDEEGVPRLDNENNRQYLVWDECFLKPITSDIVVYAEWDYYLKMFGKTVNSIDCRNLKYNYASNVAEGGSATFDISSFTIKLKDCEAIVNFYTDAKYVYAIESHMETDKLTILLEGDNRIDIETYNISDRKTAAIYVDKSNLEILSASDTGKDKLSIHVSYLDNSICNLAQYLLDPNDLHSGFSKDNFSRFGSGFSNSDFCVCGIDVSGHEYFQGEENNAPIIYMWIGVTEIGSAQKDCSYSRIGINADSVILKNGTLFVYTPYNVDVAKNISRAANEKAKAGSASFWNRDDYMFYIMSKNVKIALFGNGISNGGISFPDDADEEYSDAINGEKYNGGSYYEFWDNEKQEKVEEYWIDYGGMVRYFEYGMEYDDYYKYYYENMEKINGANLANYQLVELD